MKTVSIPKSLLERFLWDERLQEYSYLMPRPRPTWSSVAVPHCVRYLVKFCPEGGFVLIPTNL